VKKGWASYRKNDNPADDGCHDDKQDSREQEGQGKLLLETDVYRPEELFGIHVSKTGEVRLGEVGKSYRKGNRQQVHVCQHIRDQNRENVEFRVGWLTDCEV
jgi:hypothetical protein